MKKLIIAFVRQYRKAPSEAQRAAGQAGTIVFVYKVTGNEDNIKNYLDTKKDFIKSVKQEDGQINFFSTRYIGKAGELMLTNKGAWVIDTTELDQLHNLEMQYGKDIAREVANKPVTE